MLSGCADEDLAPIVTFDQATTGAYPRVVEETGSTLVNLFDVPNSQYGYTVEFVDAEQGNLVAEYVLEVTYVDANPDNGDASAGPIEYARFTQDDFTTNEGGYREISVSIPATELVNLVGTTADDLMAGDEFSFVGRLILTDGREFADANSAPQITGSAFRGLFDYTLSCGCPSDIGGTFDYTTTNIWCGADPVSGSVELASLGAGIYSFDDWSFGTYDGVCYGAGTTPPVGDLQLQDVCNMITIENGATSQYGDTFTFSSSISGNEWTIEWSNDFGEAGTTVLFFPGGGDWPLTIVE